LTFEILSDRGNEVASRFGLKFALPDYLRTLYATFPLDLATYDIVPIGELKTRLLAKPPAAGRETQAGCSGGLAVRLPAGAVGRRKKERKPLGAVAHREQYGLPFG